MQAVHDDGKPDDAALSSDVSSHTPAATSDGGVEPECWWEHGKVVHLHQATQCGRVHIPDYGDLNFTDRTPLEPGLALRQGIEVGVRLIERGRNWVQVKELAKLHMET